ncbi:hypothetical protein MPL3356_340202 [Mesorhizobium plurifarium]|uniref:Uncharacterized protein n=1 Tax=Mesorhizobium plurifarium TaxID=69974 RepID=A0A090E2V6_MESPL|nr:hypothetical protein MPL3356_340202 [Mesorhizobium plurifarium]
MAPPSRDLRSSPISQPRNPAHELLALDMIREKTGLPVTASHELASKRGGPRRALTTLLNARLISMIDNFVAATEGFGVARKRDCRDKRAAFAVAEISVRAIVADLANRAGTDTAEIEIAREISASTIAGQRMLIEAHVVAVATGRPRIAA